MELSRGQPPQSPVAYMRAQPVPPMAYDEYRRNSSSSSSYGYSDSRNREWGAYLSPTSRHSETAWSPPPSHHQHHHHHGGRQDTATSSPPSRSMAGENSTSQAQYLSGYVGTHSNSRYRPGYWYHGHVKSVYACMSVFLYQKNVLWKTVFQIRAGYIWFSCGWGFRVMIKLDCWFCYRMKMLYGEKSSSIY